MNTSKPAPKLVHLTTYAGWEKFPSFSPDGRQVAFFWDGEKGASPGIYVKLIGDANALRLTNGSDGFPVWSPDGKRIAFVRGVEATLGPKTQGGDSIYTVSALGGAERKLLDTKNGRQISWSPDGKWLALVKEHAIFVPPLDGGEPHGLSNPQDSVDSSPAFSPDGERIAYANCLATKRCEIYVQDLGRGVIPSGGPRQITHHATEIYGLTWSRDGRSIIYSAAQAWSRPYLWRAPSSGGGNTERLDMAGSMVFAPSASPVANRLAFEKSAVDADIWRYRADGSAPEPLIVSSLFDFAPQYSPDGTKIAFCSDRGGEGGEIWVAKADGSGPVQLTNGPGRNQGTPRWSPDGRWIAFDSQGDDGKTSVYVMEAGGGSPRRLTPGSMPFWPPGGKWIYFTNRGQIWRVPFGGGRVEQTTPQGGLMGYVSADGATLFYVKSAMGPLFSRLLSGGEEQEVLPDIVNRGFMPTADGIYYIDKPDDQSIYPLAFYSFSSKSSRVIGKISGVIIQGLSVSPDGKSILISRSVNNGSDLLMIENY